MPNVLRVYISHSQSIEYLDGRYRSEFRVRNYRTNIDIGSTLELVAGEMLCRGFKIFHQVVW